MIFFLNLGERRIGAGSEKSGWTGLSEDAKINRPSKFYLSIARTHRPTAGDAAANVMPDTVDEREPECAVPGDNCARCFLAAIRIRVVRLKMGKKVVWLAFALASMVLFLDEPFEGIDPAGAALMKQSPLLTALLSSFRSRAALHLEIWRDAIRRSAAFPQTTETYLKGSIARKGFTRSGPGRCGPVSRGGQPCLKEVRPQRLLFLRVVRRLVGMA
jgi:hypothetical protein